MPCDGGYCIENTIVQETGEYNAFFADSYASVRKIKARAMHQLAQMGNSDKFDIHILNGVVPNGIPHHKDAHWVSHGTDPASANLKRIYPEPEEYWRWYETAVRGYCDFTEEWWQSELVSHRIFISQFKPVWYLHGNRVVGRIYRLETYSFVRLFSIVVEDDERGKGYGQEIIVREVNLTKVPVYIRASEDLSRFYEKAGFKVGHYIAKIAQQGDAADGLTAATDL